MARKAKKTADDYSRRELYARAERKGVKYRSRMNKEQLFKALGLGEPKGRKKPAAEAGRKKAALPAAKRKARPAARKAAPRKKKRAPAGKKKTSAGRKPKATAAPEGPAEPRLAPAGGSDADTVAPPPPPPPPASAYLDRGPALPAGYGEDRLVALVRDPRCIFAYWELGGGGYGRTQDKHGEAELAAGVWVLRLVEVPGERFFDVPVDPGAGNWYLHVEPAGRYMVRLGLVLPSGAFVELAASGEVATPSESVSGEIDEEWMQVREEFDRLVGEILALHAAGGAGWSETARRLAELPRRMDLSSGGIGSPRGGRH